jgi:hypothetical protein
LSGERKSFTRRKQRGMPPRKKAKAVDAPIVYVEGEESLSIFGWCSTEQHGECRIEFPGHKCSCECHRESDDKEDTP